MPYTTEFIIAAIIFASILCYFARPKYKDRKSMLLSKYRRIRAKSLDVQNTILQHMLVNDAQNEEFLPNLTYGQFIRNLRRSHELYLSEKTYLKIKNSCNVFFLNKTERSFEEQEKHLDDIEKRLIFEESEKNLSNLKKTV